MTHDDQVLSTANPGSGPVSRRKFLTTALVGAGGLAAGGAALATHLEVAGATSGTITVGSVLDQTGPINIYGLPMVDATRFAIDSINKSGGVLGKRLQLIQFDGASSNDTYRTRVQQLILQHRVSVIMGGITSASREAIRPLMDRHGQLYFYNEQYEGGVCDKWVFSTGVVPSQQLSTLITYAASTGSSKIYTLAADYNYGHISSDWVKVYIGKHPNLSQVGLDFFPLDVTDFSQAINKIERSKADTVMSLLVGGNHISFYRQFAARGLKGKIKIVSPTYGLGNEQVVLTPSEGRGIVVAYPYFQEINNPVNRAWVAAWHRRFGAHYPYITDSANTVWIGWHLWAKAVNKAGSTDRDKVIKALESGLQFSAPSGLVRLDRKSHAVIYNVHIGVGNSRHGFNIVRSYPAIRPDPKGQCNLIAHPGTHTQYTP